MSVRSTSLDGLAAVREIRARADAKAQTPVIFATADTGLHVRKDCLAAGADEVLLKPLKMRKLFDAIGSAMAQRAGGVVG